MKDSTRLEKRQWIQRRKSSCFGLFTNGQTDAQFWAGTIFEGNHPNLAHVNRYKEIS